MPRHRIPHTAFAGPITEDLTAIPKPDSEPVAGKQTVDWHRAGGGGSLNSGEAYGAAGGQRPFLVAVTGVDDVGNRLAREYGSQFARLIRAAALSTTRQSVIAPDPVRGTMTFTSRPVLDEAAAFAFFQAVLKPDVRLVLASFTHEEQELVDRLIDAHPGETCLLLTADQCRHPETTIPMLADCALNWLNADELAALTGVDGDVAAGINELRSRGVGGVIVTDGPRGATGFIDDRWLHAPAFDVEPVNGASRCGDYAFGTFLAGIDRGESPSDALRTAMAAAAMHLAGVPRTGWESIVEFARITPTKAYVPPSRPEPAPMWRERVLDVARPATYVALGAAVMLAVQLMLLRAVSMV